MGRRSWNRTSCSHVIGYLSGAGYGSLRALAALPLRERTRSLCSPIFSLKQPSSTRRLLYGAAASAPKPLGSDAPHDASSDSVRSRLYEASEPEGFDAPRSARRIVASDTPRAFAA